MNGPRRFSEDPEVRQALHEAADVPRLSEARRAAFRDALATTFLAAPSPPVRGPAKVPLLVGASAAGLGVLALAVALVRTPHDHVEPRMPPPRDLLSARTSPPPEASPPSTPAVPSSALTAAPRAVTNVPAPPASSPPSSPEDALAAELVLLRTARAFATADPARAQGALEAHRQRFPAGKLAMERDVLLVEVLFRRGDVARATALRNDLLRGSPSGPFARRLERASEK